MVAGGEAIEEQQGLKSVSLGLKKFIDKYATVSFEECDALVKDKDGIPIESPGNAIAVERKCREQGLQDLDDLRQLAKRIWLGELFPAKVALCMENAFDSPTFDKGVKGVDSDDDNKKGEWKTLAPDEWKSEMDRKKWLGTFHFKHAARIELNTSSARRCTCPLSPLRGGARAPSLLRGGARAPSLRGSYVCPSEPFAYSPMAGSRLPPCRTSAAPMA